jgi:hypothetical protein
MTARGLDQLEPAAAAAKAMEAHRNAEKLLGVPEDQRIDLRQLGDTEGSKKIWQRLGAPADPKEYTFEGADFGTPERTAKYAEELRTAAAEVNAPKAIADALVKRAAKVDADLRAAEVAARTAAIKEERTKLEADWGPADGDKFKANMEMSDRAAAMLNLPPDVSKKLFEGAGGAATARFFRDLATKLGEATYIANPNNAGDPNSLMGRDTAIAERQRLFGVDGNGRMVLGAGDPEIRRKLLAKDAAVTKQYTDLNLIIMGGAASRTA